MVSEIKLILLIIYNLGSTNVFAVNQNVVLIMVDDLRPLLDDEYNYVMPNLNRMAMEGVNFRNAFAQQALCAPSRNSLLTGRRPDSLHLYDFYSYWRETTNFTTLPQYFKENGYDTYSVGKIFHPGKSSNFTDDFPYSWSIPPFHPTSDAYKDAAVCKDSTNTFHRNLICPVNVNEQPGRMLPDLESLNYAVEILKSRHHSNRPFFLAVGFHKPHIPLKYPEQYLARIPLNKVRPPSHPQIPISMPSVAYNPWTDIRSRDDIKNLNLSFPYGTMPKEWALKIKQSYLAAAMYIDDLIGQLMSYVDLKKTIVVVTSDHGWSLGENGLWAKYSNFEAALKVPLIFLAPSITAKIIYKPVELIDIFPTLVSLAGLNKNISKCIGNNDKSRLCFEGKNLLLKSSSNFAISQYPRPCVKPKKNSDKPRLKYIKIMGYTIRTKRYRYTQWISFNHTSFQINWDKTYGIELYDHVIDSNESKNLYFILKYKHVIQKLSKILRSKISPDNISNYLCPAGLPA